MSTNTKDHANGLHPPPPPPDLSDSHNVPKGNKRAAPNVMQAGVGGVIVSTPAGDPQKLDQRRALGRGPHSDPNTRPHPPPPPPDLSDSPTVPKGNARHRMQIGGGGSVAGGPQRPDQRRALGTGPGTQNTYGPNYPQGPPYPGGGYSPGPGYPDPPQGPVGGYGPPQSYPDRAQKYPGSMATYPPPPSTVGGYNGPGPLTKNWRQFLRNQKVQVNVVGHGWFVGFVVALINGMQAITNSQVRVSYVDLHRQRREDDFENDPAFIRPYPNY